LQVHKDGIRIKGLPYTNKWTYFDRCDRLTYTDGYQGFVRITSSSKMIYYNKRKRIKMTFFHFDKYKNGRPYYDDHHHNNSDEYQAWDDYDDRAFDEYENSHNRKYSVETESFTSPEGSWSVSGLDKIVYIVDNRDGIKARFNDNSRWYYYRTDSRDPSLYYSDEGHSYERISDNRLIWKDKSGQRTYTLTRISRKIN
jgi:hypothetical protein